jgi:hypothetical protein
VLTCTTVSETRPSEVDSGEQRLGRPTADG